MLLSIYSLPGAMLCPRYLKMNKIREAAGYDGKM